MNSSANVSSSDSWFTALRHPSAFLPIAMSMCALGLIALHIVRFGTAPQADEGTSAHLWQLLMGLQLPIIAFFAIRWFPQRPRAALFVLALQSVAGLAAAAPVYYLGW